MAFLDQYQREIVFGAVWLTLLAWFALFCPRPPAFRAVIDEWAHRECLTIVTLHLNRFIDRMRYGISSVQECARVAAVDRQGRSQEYLLVYGHRYFGTFRPILNVRILRPPTRGPS